MGGHYFGRLLGNRGVKSEYWECDKCYKEAFLHPGSEALA